MCSATSHKHIVRNQLLAPSGPATVGAPFVSVFSQQQHVGYRDRGGTIWDSWYDGPSNNWNLQRINTGGLTRGPAAVSGPFICVFKQQQHFAYRDRAGTVWDSWNDGPNNKWNLQQINAGGLTNGPAAVGGPFVCDFNQQQHFAYRDSAGTIWDSWYDGPNNRWSLQQINAGGLTTGPAAVGGPFVCDFNQQQHFAYRDGAGVVWDSWYDGPNNKWNLQQINAGGLTPGPGAIAGPFVWVYGQQQHFSYQGDGGALWDCWYDGPKNRWRLQEPNLQEIDPLALTEGPAAMSAPFACVFNQQQHCGYRDENGVIWDSWYDAPNKQWNLQQINLQQIEPLALTLGPAACGDDSWYD